MPKLSNVEELGSGSSDILNSQFLLGSIDFTSPIVIPGVEFMVYIE